MADADAAREPGLPALTPAPAHAPPGQPLGAGGVPPSQPVVTDAADGSVMSLADHLGELRTRIVKILAAVVPFAAVGYWRAGPIIHLLRTPIGERPLVSLSA